MARPSTVFRVAVAGTGGAMAVYVAWLAVGAGSDWVTHLVTDIAYAVSSAGALAACLWTSRQRPAQRAAWTWIAAACACWLLGVLVWSFEELVLHRYSPSPSWADLGFIGYCVPAVIGLSLLASSGGRPTPRTRQWLDGAVVSLALFILSWLFVFAPLLDGLPAGSSWVVWTDSLALPIADIVIAATVLVQAMRAEPGGRGPWLILGSGFLWMVAMDAVFIRETVSGTHHAGGLLDAGWVLAFLLVGLAALVPPGHRKAPVSRLNLLQESLPFLPVMAAIVVLALQPSALTVDNPTTWLAGGLAVAVVSRYVVTTRDHLQLADSLEQKVQERTADLARQAFHDVLTGLPNRAFFLDELSRRLARPAHLARCSVLYVDLDGFKAVNDGLGHSAGDVMLGTVAKRFARSLRNEDFLARLGGDEFGVITNASDPDAIEKVAARLLESLGEPIALHGRAFTVGASIGIATSGTSVETGEDLLRYADLAMYLTKARGGGGFERFRTTEHDVSLARMDLENDLAVALELGQFEVYYQPMASLDNGEFAGAEALLRWRHPTLGLLAPDRFLDLAEQTGAIVPIGEWVLDRACSELLVWQASHLGATPLGVAVNLSGRQFGPRLITVVQDTLQAYGLDPAALTLEVTEGLIQADAVVVGETLAQLKAIGVWLAIDDFGTGHSSLGRLRDYAFDELKIDRSFVQDLDHGDSAFVTAQIALAHALGMQVVAEGVETAAQLAVLRNQGCNQVQGYLLARPMPAEQVRAIFTGHARVPAMAAAGLQPSP